MWMTLLICILVLLVLLYLPGSILLRGCRHFSILSFTVSPLISLSLYVILGIVIGLFNIKVSALQFTALSFCCVIIMLLLAYLIRHFNIKTTRSDIPCDSNHRIESFIFDSQDTKYKSIISIYIIISVFVSILCWLSVLDGFDSFSRTIDNSAHLSIIRTMLSTGSYNTLDISSYVGGQGSFYPAAWHIVTAVVAQVTGAQLVIAENASLFVFTAVVYPMGWFAALNLLTQDKRIILAGSIAASAFAAFPWRFLSYGLLASNLAANAMIPACIAIFLALTQEKIDLKDRFSLFLLLMCAGISVVTSQPNAFFALVVILTPYCIYRLVLLPLNCSLIKGVGQLRFIRAFFVACFIALVILGWSIAYRLPFMQTVLSTHWLAFLKPVQVLPSVFVASYKDVPGQFVLGFFVLMGILYTLYRRRFFWISCSYLLSIFIHGICVATDGTLKSYLSGFWYTDSYRTAAVCAIIAVPLAAFGLFACVRLFEECFHIVSQRLDAPVSIRLYKSILVALSFIFLFYPSFDLVGMGRVETPFGYIRNINRDSYNMSEVHPEAELTRDMITFAEKAKQRVGEETVLNMPFDGSGYLYGVMGLNTFYRSMLSTSYGSHTGEAEDSALLREKAYLASSNSNVSAVLQKNGISYVLLFDITNSHSKDYKFTYDPKQWFGLTRIDDSTPGFEVVLSSGNMRLYRIVA